MTKELRERYAKMLSDLGECSIDDVILGAFAFCEQEITEAERLMKERCLKAIDDRITLMDKDFDNNQPFIAEAHGIADLISSLK